MKALLDTHAALYAWIEPTRLSEKARRIIKDPANQLDIYGMLQLPETHKDPFDWLLLSNAKRRKIPLISKDAAFKDYPVDLIWS